MATIQVKRGAENDLNTITPASGEPVFSTDTKVLKIGDGVNTWASLGSFSTSNYPELTEESLTSSPISNWSPSNDAKNIDITSQSQTDTVIRGIDSSYNIKAFNVYNRSGGSNTITFAHDNGTASAGNRILTRQSENIKIFGSEGVEFIYDTSAKSGAGAWRCRKLGVQSNVAKIENDYPSAVVSGVYNIVIVSSGTYASITNKDPNTLYIVPD